MADFTMRLKRVLELTDGDIGLNSYPIFDEDYRNVLNAKIVDHFYLREIGTETIDMFRFFMRRKMNEVMPYFNQLYLSERHEYDPLSTVDMRTIGSVDTTEEGTVSTASDESAEESGTGSTVTHDEGTSEGSGTNSTTSSTKSRSVSSETPQTMLSGDGDYATSAADSNSLTEGSGAQSDSRESVNDGTSETTDSRSSTASGNTLSEDERATARNSEEVRFGREGILGSDAILKFRETLINIDMQVIAALEPLFMQIWDTGDEFYPYSYPLSYGRWY